MEINNRGNNKIFSEKAPQRVVIFRALQLGDLMTSIPSLRALRAELPSAQITLVGLPWARQFVDRFNMYVDDLLEFPGFPGLPERTPEISRMPDFLKEVQWLNFDLALQMQGSGGIANSLVALFGARHTAGFYLPGQFCPDPELFIPYPVQESEIRIQLNLLEHIGIQAQGEHLEFPLYVEDWEDLHELMDRLHLEAGGYACIHPGARADERRWPSEYFAAVADSLAGRGLQVVLTGTYEESQLTAEVASQMKSPSINMAGQTSLGSLGALLSKARLLVSNDTGVSHIADALRLPSVVMFTTSDPARWAPKDRSLHRVVAWASAAGPEMVMDEIESLLQDERVYAF